MWQGGGWQQWPIQQAMYQNVPHDQVDWAALAKQWIDMQRVGGSDGAAGPPQPFPMPPGVGNIPSSAGTPPPSIAPTQPATIIEPYRPPIVTSVRNEIIPMSVTRPTASPLNITKPSDFPVANAEPVAVTSWNSSWEASGRIPPVGSNWSAPQSISETKPPSAFSFGNSTHGNLPLQAQSYDYNHGSDPFVSQQNLNFNSNDGPYPQYWTTSGSESLPPFLRKDNRIRGDENLSMNSDDMSLMCNLDAAKRKQLPIWIREGLEKMERDRQRQQEKERLKREYEERRAQQALASAQDHLRDDDPFKKSRFESESEGENEEATVEMKVNSSKLSVPPSPIPVKGEPLTEEEKMLKVRRMLTEILLEVTNEELVQVAKEVYQRALAKAPARQLASSTALASITGSLGGLSGYGSGGSNNESDKDESSEEEEDEDSDDELRRIIAEKKNSFVIKEMEIEATLQAEENERMKEKATKKETQSNAIEEEENITNNLSNTNEKNAKMEISETKATPISRSSSSATESSSDSESSETSGRNNTNITGKTNEKTSVRISRSKSRSPSVDSIRGKTKNSLKNRRVVSRERTTTKDSKKSRRSRSGSRNRRRSRSRNRSRRSSSRNRNGGRNRIRKSRSRSRNKRSRTRSRSRNRRSRSRSRTRRRNSRSRSRNRRSASRSRRNRSRDRKSRDVKTRSRRSRSRNRSTEKNRGDKRRNSREASNRSKNKNKRSRSKSQEKIPKSTTTSSSGKKGSKENKERGRSRSTSPSQSKNKKAWRNSNSDSSDSSPHSGKKSS